MNTLYKYIAFARVGARQALLERGELFGRIAFFAVILGVFSTLWAAVEQLPIRARAEDLVWYLAATEWIWLSAPQLHVEIQEEVRRGDVILRSSRPVSYLGSVLAQGLGMLAVRAPILGLIAFVVAFLFTGVTPDGVALGTTFLLGLCGSALLTGLLLTVGVCAFWLKDTSPLYWVWQKALFVLGGLMLPLAFYPGWLQRLAQFTPFPSILCFPAGFLLPEPSSSVLVLLLQLVGWSLVSLAFVRWLFLRALRSFAVGGG